jgi:hypothetical protein
MSDVTFGRLFTSALGVVEWTVAIASVAGTIALAGWILKMILKDERSDCQLDAERKRDSAQPPWRAQPLKEDKPDELH